MRSFLIAIFLITLAPVALRAQRDSAETKTPKAVVFYKLFPLNLFGGQFPLYTSEIKIGTEVFFKKGHGIELEAGANIPSVITSFFQFIFSTSEYSDSPYWFFGGRGSFCYKYYFLEGKTKKAPGPYLGTYISGSYYRSSLRLEQHDPEGTYVDWYTTSRSHVLLTNYALIVGYRTYMSKVSFEVSGHFGYRYDYFWRSYQSPLKGNVEYDVEHDRLYHYYKKVPVGGGVNLIIGGAF